MFPTLNFLFLMSLALASWTVLRYYQPLDYYDYEEEYDIDKELSFSYEDNTMSCLKNDGYAYVNLVFITICVFALAKVVSLTEEYTLAKLFKEKEPRQQQLTQNIKNNSLIENNVIEIEHYIEVNDNLREQINIYKANNSAMKTRIRELEESNHILLRGYDLGRLKFDAADNNDNKNGNNDEEFQKSINNDDEEKSVDSVVTVKMNTLMQTKEAKGASINASITPL